VALVLSRGRKMLGESYTGRRKKGGEWLLFAAGKVAMRVKIPKVHVLDDFDLGLEVWTDPAIIHPAQAASLLAPPRLGRGSSTPPRQNPKAA